MRAAATDYASFVFRFSFGCVYLQNKTEDTRAGDGDGKAMNGNVNNRFGAGSIT